MENGCDSFSRGYKTNPIKLPSEKGVSNYHFTYVMDRKQFNLFYFAVGC